MNFKSEEDSSDSENIQESRRIYRFRSQKVNEDNIELEQNKKNKKSIIHSVEKDTKKLNLMKIRSSKSVAFNVGTTPSKKNMNNINEELIPEIIDPSYNFSLNYQLKETAINIFKSGIEQDKIKIKFFCNYLYQLSPFNKIFEKIKQSNNLIDIFNLQRILLNLSTELKYEFFEANKVIYKHGDPPDKYYILLKGEVDIIVPNEIEVMMNEYEYFNYILRLYKFQEHGLLKKVLNKNYNLYPLNKKLFEDWIHTAYNTLRHLKKESEFNRIKRKKKAVNNYITSYDNAEELFSQLEKQKKLNLLMKNKNVIILLEKIRMRNERVREAAKNGGSTEKKKKKMKKQIKNNNEENNFKTAKPTIGYTKLDGQLKKIFMNDDQIEVIEKCTTEISQLIEILSEDFNMRKYLFELNRCNSEKYLSRVEPYFFDEDNNKKLDSKLFIVSRNQDNLNKGKETKKEANGINDIRIKLQNIFNKNKNTNKNKRKNELFNNRKKTIVYHYVLVNTIYTGDTFGETSNDSVKKNVPNQRLATIITKENSHLASLKRSLYNKILKEINENNLHQQLAFLFSLSLFKDCNKNNFMKNYINFFIKKTFRANEIVFNQDEDLGEDRSIYFIEGGTFSSYCNMSVNDIESLFNNLHYEGLIPEDDAHEDNLFNKENHYFNQFKKKKIIFNLFYFTENDIIGFNDALYKGKYIYTVKCQSATATVYEIKLKFFNLIINSEEKLYKNVVEYEMIKRNLMIKFFLNAFNNKNNFYKFISFNIDENDKGDKNIIHKHYFGKNPFRESKDFIHNANSRNKSEFKKVNTIQNQIDENFLNLLSETKRFSSPNIKKIDSYESTILLHNKNRNNISSFIHKNKILFRNKSRIIMKNSKLSTEKSSNFKTIKESLKGKTFYLKTEYNDIKNKKQKKTNNEVRQFNFNNKLSDHYKDNNDILELKIEEYKMKPKNKIVIPPIITNQINIDIVLNDKDKNLYSSLFNENQDKKYINKSSQLKSFYNNKENEVSFCSSNFLDNSSKRTMMKTHFKSMNKYKKYLDNFEENITLKNNNLSKKEEIQLKCYLKDIPDFFNKDNCKKNIFFGMNKKALFQNNTLFTESK